MHSSNSQNMYNKSSVVVMSTLTYMSHNCLKYFLSLGLLLGVFPLEGLTYIDPSRLKFKILSPKMFYTGLLLTVYVFCCVLAGMKTFSSQLVTMGLISPLYYFHISGTMIICLKIAKAWPDFMTKFYLEETTFSRKYKIKTNLKIKLNITVFVATLAALIEHVLSTMNFIFSNDCGNDAEGFESYIRKHFHFIFHYFPYNTFCGIALVIIGGISTYIWIFGDLLIILMSIILTTKFDQLKEKISWYVKSRNIHTHGDISNICTNEIEQMGISFWRNIREDYDELCQICSRTNELIADMILFSYTCNGTFILIQLFISLRDRSNMVEIVYFYGSFLFVVVRTAMLCIYGGWLSEASKAALPTLNAVPTDMYNPEISRLINQIHTSSPSLTGHDFFSVTKGLVPSVAATIITYELALLQFNEDALEKFSLTANSTVCY